MIHEYIEKLRPFVLDYFKDDCTGHDIGHLERTLNNALYLCDKEGGDKLIVGISAFLHDVHRIMQTKEGKFVSPKDSLGVVRDILSHVELTGDQVEEICYSIEHHEEYNWNKNNTDNINALILQDADNLDAIGAIGIGRAFNYGGAYNIEMYNSNIPINESTDYIEEKGDDETTIHHFYHKLLKLEENMNTKTAKELARVRTQFMKSFVKEFLDEWNTNY